MLSTAEIDALVAAGELSPWLAPGVLSARRAFYATPDVAKYLSLKWRPWADGQTPEEADQRRQDMIDVIALWQRGLPLLARRQIKPLEPPPPCHGIWSLRAAEQPPGARTLGFVPCRNIYVATGVFPREVLGNKGSPGWMRAVAFATARSRAWFKSGTSVPWIHGQRFTTDDLVRVCNDF